MKDLVILVSIVSFFAGLICGLLIVNNQWRKTIIQHNAAHYNQTNKVFEWNK